MLINHFSTKLEFQQSSFIKKLCKHVVIYSYSSLVLLQLVHEEIALQWVVSNGPTREKAMSQSSFFFELMVKSMAEYLSVTNLINSNRKHRFPTQFTDDCTALVVMSTKEVVEKFAKVTIGMVILL